MSDDYNAFALGRKFKELFQDYMRVKQKQNSEEHEASPKPQMILYPSKPDTEPVKKEPPQIQDSGSLNTTPVEGNKRQQVQESAPKSHHNKYEKDYEGVFPSENTTPVEGYKGSSDNNAPKPEPKPKTRAKVTRAGDRGRALRVAKKGVTVGGEYYDSKRLAELRRKAKEAKEFNRTHNRNGDIFATN